MRLSRKTVVGLPVPRVAPGGAVMPASLDNKAGLALRIGAMQSLAELHKDDIEKEGLRYDGVQSWIAWTHNETRETQRELLKGAERLLPKQIEGHFTHSVEDIIEKLDAKDRARVIDVESSLIDSDVE